MSANPVTVTLSSDLCAQDRHSSSDTAAAGYLSYQSFNIGDVHRPSENGFSVSRGIFVASCLVAWHLSLERRWTLVRGRRMGPARCFRRCRDEHYHLSRSQSGLYSNACSWLRVTSTSSEAVAWFLRWLLLMHQLYRLYYVRSEDSLPYILCWIHLLYAVLADLWYVFLLHTSVVTFRRWS